jgi:hypothetical protein
MDHRAILAQDTHPIDVVLSADVADDLVHVGRLVLEHRETRALEDHL